ncbi:phage portal protein [Bordetella hinzii]|uniref:phage portal protein n=1 Tax=Bordetella hinzii TaxID=103855 RepID=UPI0003FFB3AE|nr:phage portal protein [Bordetella hinzii]AKQ56404.1 Phage portal protein [Bordetella hinzii]KCB28601.1 portal protein, HK97 family [Bordetella hinzii L60]SNV74796.1 phage portal protein [Bordetella hinzii]
MLSRIMNRLGYERRSTNQAPGGDSYWQDFAALRTGPVNAQTAQGVSAVFACVSAIAETVSTLPLHLYRDTGASREKARNHPLYKVLQDQPNPEQTAMEFREMMTASVLLTGNAFARIVRGSDGQVRELWPLSNVQVLRLANGKLAYEYTDRHGAVIRLLADECLHLRHRIGPDGVLGLSPIAVARGVIELAQSEQEHGTATFRHGAKLAGVLETAAVLKPEQREALKQSWANQYGGAGNSGKTPVLEAGLTYKPISMSLEDAEWIEARKFNVAEVARLFRVPPTIIGAMEAANYSNSVELNRQFVTLTLRRWLTMWEQAISTKCLTEAGRRTYFAEHSVEGLLRGDSTTRAAFYASGIQAGWMRKSEARELENLPPIEGLDDTPTQGQAPITPTQPYPSKERGE